MIVYGDGAPTIKIFIILVARNGLDLSDKVTSPTGDTIVLPKPVKCVLSCAICTSSMPSWHISVVEQLYALTPRAAFARLRRTFWVSLSEGPPTVMEIKPWVGKSSSSCSFLRSPPAPRWPRGYGYV
ncbi:hypothetical protein ABFS83_14G175100 [Erythranthe nasuta]